VVEYKTKNIYYYYFVTLSNGSNIQVKLRTSGTCKRKAIINLLRKLDSKYDDFHPIRCTAGVPKTHHNRKISLARQRARIARMKKELEATYKKDK